MSTESGSKGRRARAEETVAEEESAPLEAPRRRNDASKCRRPRCRNAVVFRTDGVAAEAVSYCREHLPANVSEEQVDDFLAGQREP